MLDLCSGQGIPLFLFPLSLTPLEPFRYAGFSNWYYCSSCVTPPFLGNKPYCYDEETINL
nr:MAG TPA: hypothetical protein [Caudoviricetes sp.]